jgi:hypothetical protein
MSPKTTNMLFILINFGRAPKLSGKLIISNTAMVLKAFEFEWKNALLRGVTPIFCYIAACKGIFRTA